jgi:hypothetical protein
MTDEEKDRRRKQAMTFLTMRDERSSDKNKAGMTDEERFLTMKTGMTSQFLSFLTKRSEVQESG